MELAIGTLIKKQITNHVPVIPEKNTMQEEILVEMQVAECIFNMASAPHEVEAAIYRMQSAELKYKAFITMQKHSHKNIIN